MGEDDVVAALADPAFYAHRPARVEHVQTHMSKGSDSVLPQAASDSVRPFCDERGWN
jgi:hypothetical protein